MSTQVFQITAPHFCAGGEMDRGRVIFAAPIIAYMTGWLKVRVEDYCKSKKWKLQIL